MPDTNPEPTTDAEQIARRVIKRWNMIVQSYINALSIITLIAIMLVADILFKGIPLRILLSVSVVSILGAMYLMYTPERRFRLFVRRLSKEEREALQVVVSDGTVDQASTAKVILEYCEKTVPEKEYVRASAMPEQTETLLRSAQPHADNAQEQLLRPTQE